MTIETESSGQTAGNQAVRQVSGPSRRPSGTSLGVAGRTEINQLVPQAEANVVSQNLLVSTSRKEIRWCDRFGQGSGAGLLRAGAWGPAPQRLGARAPRGLGPGPQSGWDLDPFVILKSLLVGGWRRGGSQLKRLPQMWGPAGTGYPPYPPPPPPTPPAFLDCKGERKRVFTLSVTETIQHAPQGRRIVV